MKSNGSGSSKSIPKHNSETKIVNEGNTNQIQKPNIKGKHNLNEDEIIEFNEDVMNSNNRPLDFLQSFILNKIAYSNIDDKNAKSILKSVKSIQAEVINDVLSSKIDFGYESRKTSELIKYDKKEDRDSMRSNKDLSGIEDSIRNMKIKEATANKENLQNKIKLLDENIKILESNDFSKIKPDTENVIDQNIKKHQVKEIKSKREVLETKVQNIELQIKNLVVGEIDFNNAKKLQIKQFLENFERDKSIDKDKYKKWEHEREERIIHFAEVHKKNEEKAKEELQRQKEELENKRKEDHKLHFEKINNRNIENKEKVTRAKENLKNKMEHRQYNYQRIEEEFKLKEEQMKNEKHNLETLEKLKRKNNLRPIRREDLDEFQKSYLEKKQELSMIKDKERILKTEEILNVNSKLTKPDSEFYKKVVEDDRTYKENEEKKKVEKIYKNLKIKNFSKVVKDNLLPRIDEFKKKELEERVNRNKLPPHHHTKKKLSYNVVFKKKHTVTSGKDDNDIPRPKTTGTEEGNFYDTNTKDNLRSNSNLSRESQKKIKPVEIRKPLEKNPDYLLEQRLRKKIEEGRDDHNLTGSLVTKNDHKWDKMLKNKKYSLVENVEMIRQKANYLEEKAREEEKFIELSGGAGRNPDLGEKMSGMLIDSIKAKLAILDSIATDN